MKEIQVKQLVISTLKTRGNGKDIPVRDIIEVYDFDGSMIAEWDAFSFTIESIIEIINPYVGTSDMDKIKKQLIQGG